MTKFLYTMAGVLFALSLLTYVHALFIEGSERERLRDKAASTADVAVFFYFCGRIKELETKVEEISLEVWK